MRNLPALSRVRKAARLFLWGGGALGWAVAGWFGYAPPAPPPVEVEARGAALSLPWDEDCVPVVASRRGKRYYFAWCEGAGRLSPQNLVEFCGPEAAEGAGLTRAEGCGDVREADPPTL